MVDRAADMLDRLRRDHKVAALLSGKRPQTPGQTLQTPINELDVDLDPPTTSANRVNRGIGRVWAQLFGRSQGGVRRIRSTMIGAIVSSPPMLTDGKLEEVDRQISWGPTKTYTYANHCHYWEVGVARSESRLDWYADNGTTVIASVHTGTVGVLSGDEWELVVRGYWVRSTKLICNDFASQSDNRLTMSAYSFSEL